MTPDDLAGPADAIAELRALRESATPGDLFRRVGWKGRWGHPIDGSRDNVAIAIMPADADLIPAAWNALGPLLDVADAADQVLAEIEADPGIGWDLSGAASRLRVALATLHARPVPR